MTGATIALRAERHTLAKRRWRGVADDGREFGFDLETPLHDGELFFAEVEKHYVIAQLPEPVLELRITDCGSRMVADLAWKIGNLHFQMELGEETIRVADDPALRQLFEREHVRFIEVEQVFRPLGGAHSHEH